jgi:hypothetical protein
MGATLDFDVYGPVDDDEPAPRARICLRCARHPLYNGWRRADVSTDGRLTLQVSPQHTVTVDEDYAALIKRAPQQDLVVRTLAKRTAGDVPLMSGELVIASWATREKYPLAAQYPLHFRKTYYPGRLRGDTSVEFERHTRASQIIGVPPPIGYAGGTFRSCLLPGKPFDQLVVPFGSEPEDSNIRHADALSLTQAAGLWFLAERIFGALTTLQAAGLTHGDAELHNFIVVSAPLDALPIDFDMALVRGEVSDEAFEARCAQDLEPILRIAVYLQCALGAQPSPLGELSQKRMSTLFRRAQPFARAIEARARLFS